MTDLDRLAEMVEAYVPDATDEDMVTEVIVLRLAPALIAVARDAMGLAYVCAATDRDEPCWECWQCRARAHQTVLGAELAVVFDAPDDKTP